MFSQNFDSSLSRSLWCAELKEVNSCSFSIIRKHLANISNSLAIVFIIAGLSVAPTYAKENDVFEAHIIDMTLTSALDILSGELGIEFMGARSNKHRVIDLRVEGTAQDVVDKLMHHSRMDAFKFNGQIYYSPIEERAVRLIPLGDLTATEVRGALDAAGLNIQGYEISEVANGGALVMSGPVQYLALCEGVINAFAKTPDDAEAVVRVRRAGILVSDGATVLSDEVTKNEIQQELE